MLQGRRLGRGGVARAGVQVDEQAPRVVGVDVEPQACADRVDALRELAVVAERDRLRLTAAGAWCALGRRLGDDGEFAEGVDAVRASLRLDAYSDDAWRLLVDLHTRAGNPAAAQAAALEHGQVLAELGLGAEPAVRVSPS